MDNRLIEIAQTVADEAVARSGTLSTDMHELEDLVASLSRKLEGQLSTELAAARHGDRFGEGRTNHAQMLLDTVRDALSDNRVDLYLQPVVSMPQRHTVFYESFSRLRDEAGRVLMPAEYMAVAEPEGLVGTIDNLLLFRCVQIVRRLAKQDRKVGIFCNISLASLSDELFFPQFLEFLQVNKDLARADIKYVKIDAELLLEQLTEQNGRVILRSLPDLQAADFADLTRRYGLEVIAEKVESERQIVDVLELNIGYGQGHLFGEPRASRDAILAEGDPPADFFRASLRRRAAGL